MKKIIFNNIRLIITESYLAENKHKLLEAKFEDSAFCKLITKKITEVEELSKVIINSIADEELKKAAKEVVDNIGADKTKVASILKDINATDNRNEYINLGAQIKKIYFYLLSYRDILQEYFNKVPSDKADFDALQDKYEVLNECCEKLAPILAKPLYNADITTLSDDSLKALVRECSIQSNILTNADTFKQFNSIMQKLITINTEENSEIEQGEIDAENWPLKLIKAEDKDKEVGTTAATNAFWQEFYDSFNTKEKNNRSAILASLGSTFKIQCKYFGFTKEKNPFIHYLLTKINNSDILSSFNLNYNNYAVLHNAFINNKITKSDLILSGNSVLKNNNIIFCKNLFTKELLEFSTLIDQQAVLIKRNIDPNTIITTIYKQKPTENLGSGEVNDSRLINTKMNELNISTIEKATDDDINNILKRFAKDENSACGLLGILLTKATEDLKNEYTINCKLSDSQIDTAYDEMATLLKNNTISKQINAAIESKQFSKKQLFNLVNKLADIAFVDRNKK